jgi:hypothetical protein
LSRKISGAPQTEAGEGLKSIVHSLTPSDAWFEDYRAFLGLYGIDKAEIGQLYLLCEVFGLRCFSGWAHGSVR